MNEIMELWAEIPDEGKREALTDLVKIAGADQVADMSGMIDAIRDHHWERASMEVLKRDWTTMEWDTATDIARRMMEGET